VPRVSRLSSFLVGATACVCLGIPAAALGIQDGAAPDELYEIPLPGGVHAALEALDDPATPDRSHFLLDLIRRHHQHAARRADPAADRTMAALLAHLERATAASMRAEQDTVPLPLAPRLWIEVVFGGHASEETLVAAILRSRDAALLYHGLLSLDAATRAWLAGRPSVIGALAGRSALFATAAPGIRVRNDIIELPGGIAATPVWEALVGHPVDDPEGFLNILLGPRQSRLAYFVWAMSQLTAPQLDLALGLGETTLAGVDTPQRLLAIFDRLGWDWRVADRPFWRPPLDPALLVAELATDDAGRPVVPGTRAFWQQAFGDVARGAARPLTDEAVRAAVMGEPVDFVWLCEQIFDGTPLNPEVRYQIVLFASRIVRSLTSDTARDALDAVRTAGAYPALSSTLERAGIQDAAVFAAVGRRAAEIAGIGPRAVAGRTLAQFQGTLALLTRAAARSPEPRDQIARTVASLAAIEMNARGEYEGRVVQWLDSLLRQAAARGPRSPSDRPAGYAYSAGDASLDVLLRDAVAGAFTMPLAVVDWEGTRYRVDLAHGERIRIDHLLGSGARAYASAAAVLVRLADALEAHPGADALRAIASDLETVADDAGWGTRPPAFVGALTRHAGTGDARAAARLAPDLRLAADDLLAQGLLELTYAAALGQPDRIPISAPEAARRHGFGLGASDRRQLSAWRPPLERHDPENGWRVSGSLLGLDARLAPFSVLQLSSLPPARRPTLNDQDRRAMLEVIPLVAPAALVDADRDTIVAALQRGRVRLATLTTAADARALADVVRMSAAKRSLFAWAAVHDRDALPRFLSAGDLLWLGLPEGQQPDRFHAWGAPARPRIGCLCLRVPAPRSEELFWGRWHAGLRVSTFPDLNLRLAELLAELQMPAPLLGPVLAPAVLDFVNLVVSRDPDDRRGLIEFAQSLQVDQMEQYLAALTTDGPLVPIGVAPEPRGTPAGVTEAP
jgi:hypothetical protein